MKWSCLWCLAAVAALCLLDCHTTLAAPHPGTDDLLKTLQDLEQIYSSMARPSVRSGPANAIQPHVSPKVQRAMKMLTSMQYLERLYADRARPRFGKRDRNINDSGLYHNAGAADYVDVQSNDDGMNVPVAKWGVGGMAPDITEMRTVRDRISTRDEADSKRQRQLQHLQQLYQNRLN